ncbi:MAG: response regulator transcription factor [Nesterenkonia sp.]
MEHLAHVRSPLVLLTAPYDSDATSLINQVAERVGANLAPCPTAPVAGRVLQRRLTILDEMPAAAPYEAAQQLLAEARASSPDEQPLLLSIGTVELLDQDSSTVVDVLLREQRAGVIMTCASQTRLSFRYSRPMQGPRGLTVELAELSEAEFRSLLHEVLGAAPTSTLGDYLWAITSGAAGGLRTAAQVGLNEGWISIRGSASALTYPPAWMDRLTAAEMLARLRQDLGDAAVELLRRVAVGERTALREFTHDAETRDALFWMAEAGLLVITGGYVHLNRPILRHPLVLSAGPTESAPPANTARPTNTAAPANTGPTTKTGPSPSCALHQAATAETPCDTTIMQAAAAHLERGLLEQARFLAIGLAEDDPRRICLTASVQAVSGAPRTALHTVEGLQDPQAATLHSFIRGALRSSPDPEDTSLAELSARLHVFNDYQPQQYIETFPAAPVDTRVSPAAAPTPTVEVPSAGEESIVDVDLLIRASRAALDAYAAALADQSERADASWRAATATPLAQLPILAAGWVIERLGMARIFNDPGAELFPEGWFDGESPERRLFYALTLQGQRLLQDLVCGVETEQLRQQTQDLWNQFEAGLPIGALSRRFMEAMDQSIAGSRSAELDGPPELLPLGLSSTFRDATIDSVVLLGWLLRAPLSELADTIEEVFQRSRQVPGMRRTALRCLLLRRGAEMPAQLLQVAIDFARRAQVNNDVLAAAERLADPQSRERVLGQPVPGRPGLRFCSAPQPPAADRQELIEAASIELLSAREGEIAKHLMAGAGAADVATDLHISVRTVHTHVRNIYRKLDVSSRMQLRARLAQRQASR